MSEQQAVETEPKAETADYTPPASQEDLNRIIADRLAREKAKYADYEDLKSKATEFDRIAEAQKTEAQRLQERAEAAERELEQARSESLRLSVIARHGIPEEFQDFVYGTTPDELEAKAEKVKTLMGTSASKTPRADYSQGTKARAGEQSPAEQFADIIRAKRG